MAKLNHSIMSSAKRTLEQAQAEFLAKRAKYVPNKITITKEPNSIGAQIVKALLNSTLTLKDF